MIKYGYGSFKRFTSPMVDWGTHEFKKLHTGKITTEELFMNDYTEEVYESEYICTATKQLRIILETKYEKSDLHKLMENQYQHLTVTQRNEFIKLLKIFEEIFDITLGTWK